MQATSLPFCNRLDDLLGKPWRPNATGDAYDCWTLTCEVQKRLFGRELPQYQLGGRTTLDAGRAIRHAVDAGHWRKVGKPTSGCLITMGSSSKHHHVGSYLGQGLLIHCTAKHGVVCAKLALLSYEGYTNLAFWEQAFETA